MSIQAYQRAATQAESPRELEYRAFGQATAALIRAQEAGVADLSVRAEALETNRRLWSLLCSDCLSEGNTLPPRLRAQIVSLALWVSKHSSEVLRAGADVQPLIDVNKSMMEGLSAR
ncbi:MAG: flagellar biosynthesis regulator FlaF [Alphaproteobacteria bacterium]|nr:flagellar biosynthesis regulator FlaF [Alphaproteobacteria bacterium]